MRDSASRANRVSIGGVALKVSTFPNVDLIVPPSGDTSVKPCNLRDAYDWASAPLNFHQQPVHKWPTAMLKSDVGLIGPGFTVEVPNTDYLNTFEPGANLTPVYWVALVKQVVGYRVRLRHIGCDDAQNDFWMSLGWKNVRNIKYAADNSCVLVPLNYIRDNQDDWKTFLVQKLVGARTLYGDWATRVMRGITGAPHFKIGMRLEAVHRTNPDKLYPFRIRTIIGNRMLLERSVDDWEGDDKEELDIYWFSFHSTLIFPVGWARRAGYDLCANNKYKRHCEAIAAEPNRALSDDARPEIFRPDPLSDLPYFDTPSESSGTAHLLKWEENMKFECIDPVDMNTFNVATVKELLGVDGWMRVAFEGSQADDIFPVHMRSPYIFPVGFAHQHDIKLSLSDDTDFKWADYLTKTKSLGAPAELFEHNNDAAGFTAGMKVECVDRAEPSLLCVATIRRVVANRLLLINFDGWGENLNQWVDYRSHEFYPVGWAEMVGHKLTEPHVDDAPAAKRSKK